jgi:hypothetical protein
MNRAGGEAALHKSGFPAAAGWHESAGRGRPAVVRLTLSPYGETRAGG